jgi:SecD/SecF fusion protein
VRIDDRSRRASHPIGPDSIRGTAAGRPRGAGGGSQGQAMRNYRLIFFLLLATVVGSGLAIWSKGLKLGIDLSGGTILVYKIKESTRAAGRDNSMDELIAALQKRVNPEGVSDTPIRKVGNNRLEIILANKTPEEVELLKRKITDVGSLEFRILANQKHDAEAIRRATNAPIAKPPTGFEWMRLGEVIEASSPRIVDATSVGLAGGDWVIDRYKGSNITLVGKDSTGKEVTRALKVKSNTPDAIVLDKPHNLASIASFRVDYNPSEIMPSDDAIVREEPAVNGRTERYILVKLDRYNVTGDYLARANATTDERVQPAVGFFFNSQGARKFGGLTGSHLPEEDGQFKYRLAVILDGLIRSAPSINSRITDSGIIEGVQPEEVNYLVEILRAGSLPASLDPTPELEEKIGPTLGQDTIQKGLRAITVSLVVVPIVMVLVYNFAGLVAVFAMFLNMLLLVASMALTDSSFTLPGLAGLALTIGMSVDANVLIFERMREEKEKGASLGQQIRNGFDKAWVTIFDSNITTILSGMILWFVGTQEIKGFALTLIIGLVWNLFTAVWVSRVIFDFSYSRGWLKKLSFRQILPHTSFDFIGPRRYCIAASLIVITIGTSWFIYQGKRNYNIDFTGGTLVTIRLNEQAPAVKDLSPTARASYVRGKAGATLPDVAVESLNIGSEAAGLRFNIRTTNDNVADVQRKVVEAFGPVLDTVGFQVGVSQPIAALPAPAEPAKDATGKDATGKAAAAPAVDRFAGGRSYALTFTRAIEPSTIAANLDKVLSEAKISNPQRRYEIVAAPGKAGEGVTSLTLRTDLDPAQANAALTGLTAALKTDPGLLFDRLENFGGAVAGETRVTAYIAIILSWLVIIAYVWFRFKSVAFGVAAVIALVHDLLIAVGAVAISPYKIDLPMVAAFLTLIGFSVNDTIVIFDRIRELRGKTPHLTPEVINGAINQTLSRTILTSTTAWSVVFILYWFGGEGLRGFSFALVIGFLSGVYSTVYIAAPILIEWLNHERVTGSSAKDSGKRVPAKV